MNLKSIAKQIQDRHVLFAGFDILFLVLSGILAIFHFERTFFETTDWIKLVLLSGAISTPLIFINMALASVFEKEENMKKDVFLFVYFSIACMSATFVLNAPLLIIYWEKWQLTGYMISAGVIEVGVIVVAFIQTKFFQGKNNRKEVGQKKA